MSNRTRSVGYDWQPFLTGLSIMVVLGGALLGSSVWALAAGEVEWGLFGIAVFVVNAVPLGLNLRNEWPLR